MVFCMPNPPSARIELSLTSRKNTLAKGECQSRLLLSADSELAGGIDEPYLAVVGPGLAGAACEVSLQAGL